MARARRLPPAQGRPHPRQKFGVHPVGLGQRAGGAGKLAGVARIDPAEGNAAARRRWWVLGRGSKTSIQLLATSTPMKIWLWSKGLSLSCGVNRRQSGAPCTCSGWCKTSGRAPSSRSGFQTQGRFAMTRKSTMFQEVTPVFPSHGRSIAHPGSGASLISNHQTGPR